MNRLHRLLTALASASFFIASAHAQNTGTVTNHAFPIGKGAGVQGYGSLLLGNTQIPVDQTGADPQAKTVSGDATLAATGALTLATVNANVGSFGSATQCTAFTTNGKGLITAASAVTCTPALASITGLGTGVATALAVNVGSAGAVVVNGGALGTPSSGTLTNATGLPTTALTGTLQAAQEPAHTGDVTNSAGSLALTLATVNSNVGSFGSATAAPTFTVNGKGLITRGLVIDHHPRHRFRHWSRDWCCYIPRNPEQCQPARCPDRRIRHRSGLLPGWRYRHAIGWRRHQPHFAQCHPTHLRHCPRGAH
jgi:hypothetical protein